ncbi:MULTISPECIES: ribonuclease HII [Metallosphaera]|uniref:Ribonuclease n=3 Tax=Metallosphaera TaxID=41980 RepID=A4YEI4_METS5|nr:MULTISPECIES: ribonuclease HII [Metallosphaera]ABP94836.1 RNase HII [Metallosphaera sedula DSM 5348]AIM26823.1 RNase HII [Metallosphaera sedula]AKV73771.1 ribonuclease HII [Metallosphaera sedula]AKV76011.1 ribonuclease HII [Metallosphaera sedula]AKV78262.1 ribonuclease HII [Metallosphaera sedula]
MRIGIDEAGRGCLIGPMVVVGVALNERSIVALKQSGVKDSKKLTRKKREELFDLILSESEGVAVAKALPEEIDNNNLNSLTYTKVIEIIDALSWLNPEVVTVDKVGKEIEVIRAIEDLGFKPNVVHKADELFVEASSASIVAKVIRDRLIESLKKEFGDFGSGYPSDRKTVQWVLDLVSRGEEPPNIIRRSWKLLLKYAPGFYVNKVS